MGKKFEGLNSRTSSEGGGEVFLSLQPHKAKCLCKFQIKIEQIKRINLCH